LGIRDGLTDLFNRRHMLEQIGYICKMCKRYSLPVGVAIIDVDHFKEVNDQYGHLVGDEVLIELAGLLRRSATRESDIIGRYGGDELIVILPDAGLEGAWNFGERLLAAVRGHEFCPSTHRLHLTVSIGVTSVPGEDAAKMPCSELVAHADQALYTAKRKGRNCMCAWSGGVDAVLEGTVLADRRNQPAFDAPVGDHPDAKREAVISALCAVMYAGRDEVEVHSEKAREMARILGRRMGISDRELQDVADGAVLHDIGKIGIPRHLLTKTSELSEEDWVVLRRHPEFGYEILRRFECLGTVPSIVHCHHEWFNGEGYPRGLEGDDIPLAARIVAVLDAYEAMRGGRVYREPRSREECVAAIKEASGTQFDPAVVEAFLNSLDAIERVGDWERSAARDLKASGITG
jgi:diguanylate cyclase (GGDEF)-like protein